MKDGLIDTSVTQEEVTRESLEQKLGRVETELQRLEGSFDQLFSEFACNTQSLKGRVTNLETTAKAYKKAIQKDLFINYSQRLATAASNCGVYQ